MLSVLLKSLDFEKSIKVEKTNATDTLLQGQDWVRPGRPVSDEEHEMMLAEAEAEYGAGLGMTSNEAKKLTMEKFEAWKKSSFAEVN